ncbi:uncharacterized aarF domain-containing protein kinase 5 isoform X1 [Pseudomyrmex gracilis]|uniref:uncharacterized aarF domain-containing protein kinase 5 isoform X1 n=1 Tax=Pseudomyrmex gracilis TaxID=219809 RepID=UPI0009954D2C|nr:uncharacterized aarF domain-containing protein kinase 5 isoform X1 [Pseudomyrmex gracilis]XP_020295019.1 uncharacterized aarF domain-containing protein kinase 5 isoform X1 [Pseudomyrmex gracilis]XP_020295028.1 uncharacterized aarF domain-containing protein kinase 5 isoform X1 [Pseudomyrmex gracilis]XP_020295037.1 uncharacterized aarF domain-containing protein kinase 5 isoform X1 [Pseudomyrmex gracilis]XP_020295046.1 uncharacterized aarF domain-containing protein kinase 5 isoform X1 [Pseudomy
MLRTRLRFGYLSTSPFLSSRIAYVGTGIALVSVSYALLPSRKKRTVRSVAGSCVRFARSLKIGLTISLDYLIAPVMGYTDSEIHERSADRIVEGCLRNGGIYIKVGQGLAAINHILPKEYTERLSLLQDKCLTRENDEMKEIFLQDFNKNPEEMLRKIEPEPVAAASLAQVYKGVTLDGDEVAIKVQYIDLQDRFKSDLKAMMYLLKAVTVIHPKFDLYWVLDEIIDTLYMELDFENEGKNGERCAKDLKKFDFAHIPKVYWDLTTKRVLTTEWIDGVKVTDVKGIKDMGLDIADVDKKLIALMGEQIFHTGFVHADPHPGNVLVRKGKDKKAQIVLLDHGLYEYLPDNTRHVLCKFWESMVLRNNNSLKALASDLNVTDYALLAEMLLQAPYQVSFATRPNDVTLENYMKQTVQNRFDKITDILKSMPKNMMLVIRNLNMIRAIVKDHGDIVNRYRIMARIATRGKYRVAKQSFYKTIARTCSVVHFEIRIFCNNLLQWISKLYLLLLRSIGYDVASFLQTI